jgi:pimeloyl-ACP methyl ester carboxylesterase
VSLRQILVPTTFVAGRFDILASAQDMLSAARRLADADYVLLHGTHFLQLEHPDEVHRHLHAFLSRVGHA